MQIDRFKIEILEDGTIKTTTDAVSAANHDNAEQFLRAMAHLAGGETKRERRTDVKPHHHDAHQHTKASQTEQRG
jgi:hypothetical protein